MADNKTSIVITAEDRASRVIGDIGGSLRTLAGNIAPLSGALASLSAGATLTGLGAMAKQAIDAADGMAKMAQKVGVGVESLSKLNYAASLSDVSTEQLGAGLQKLAKNIQDAGDGTKEAVQAFGRIGVAFKNSDGSLRGVDAVLKDIAARFAVLPDSTAKTASAMELMGRSGANMIPLLNSGAAGMDAMAQEAERLGIVIGDDFGNAAQQFNDNLTRMEASAKGVGIAIANAIVPPINEAVDSFMAARSAGLSFFQALTGIGVRGINETLAEATANSGQRLNELRTQLDALQKKRDGLDFGDFYGEEALGKDIANVQALIRYFEQLQLKTIKTGPQFFDARDLRPGADLQIAQFKAAEEAAKKSAKVIRDEFADVFNRITSRDAGVDSSFWKDLATLNAGYKSGRIDVDAYRDAVAKLTQQQQFAKDIAKASADAEKAYADAAEKARQAAADSVGALQERAIALEDELANYGKTKSEIEETIIARLEEQRVIEAGFDDNAELVANLEKEIDARKRARDAMRGIEAKDTAKKAADDAAKAWENFSRDIEQSLTDALMRSFESGDSFGEAFAKNLKNTFKSMILKVAVQAVVSPVMSGMQSVLGIGQAANSAGGLMGSASGLFNGVSALNSLSMASGVGTAGAGLYGAFATSAVGQSLGLSAVVPGLMGPTTTGAALGSATAGGATLTSVGAAMPYVAAAAAIASMLMKEGGGPKNGGDAFYAISNNRASLMADTGDETSRYGLYTPSDANTRIADMLGKQLEQVLDVIVKAGGKLASGNYALGYDTDPQGTAGNRVSSRINGTLMSVDVGRDDAALQAELTRQLNLIITDAIKNADFEEGTQALADTLFALGTPADAVIASLKPLSELLGNIGLPLQDFTVELVDMLGGLESATSSLGSYYSLYYTEQERYEASLRSMTSVFDQLGVAMPSLSDGADAARAGLRAMIENAYEIGDVDLAARLVGIAPAFSEIANSAQTMSQSVGSSIDRLFDRIQSSARAAGSVAVGFGSSDPQFYNRAQQNLQSSLEAGRASGDFSAYNQNLAALTNTGGSSSQGDGGAGAREFFEQNQSEVAARVQQYASETESRWNQFVSQRDNIRQQIARLQGGDAERALSIQLLSERSIQSPGYFAEGSGVDELIALQQQLNSLAAAAEAAANGTREAAEAEREAEAIKTQYASLERRLLQLQGNTTRLRELDLAALYDSNRAIQQQIWSLEDQAAAADEARRATEAAAAAAKAIADEYYSLETRLLQLQGNTTELRARELAKLDPANRAIQEQIWALEDQAKAAQEAASAAESLRSTWENLAKSIRDQVENIRGQIAEDATFSMAALQARFAIATAQARAGDQDAAGNLVSYSNALLESISNNAVSRDQMLLDRARVAESLEGTANIISGPINQATLFSDSTKEMTTAIADLTQQVADLKGQLSDIQRNTLRTADAVNGAGEQPMLVETV